LSSEIIKISSKNLQFTQAKHNYQNLLATYTTHFLLKKNPEKFIESIKTIKNLEHRIEFIGSIKNINFYNDSKATNVDSAITAINSLENILWILGGREKKGGLNGVENKLKRIIKAYAFGEASLNFKKFLNKTIIKCENFNNLKEAFEAAMKDAKKIKKNVTILLSPGCSSFDQFKNYEERGFFFKKLVSEKLKNEQ
jgi:UDP-N-acetylmuramoylalanine--D-glutamate ligase